MEDLLHVFDPSGPTRGLFPQTQKLELIFTAYVIVMFTLTPPFDIDMPTVTNLNNKNNIYE